MDHLALHEFHRAHGGRYTEVNGAEAVLDYGDVPAEHAVLGRSAGLLDLSFRSRLCLTGADRARFLHGQVTNDIKGLALGAGRYAALVTAKGRMESDLYIYSLADELLLDFEPGLRDAVARRLEKYVVADDVQVVDVAPLYGLLSVQGPAAGAAVAALGLFPDLPSTVLHSRKLEDATLGELYLVNQPRLGTSGFDLFVPAAALAAAAGRLLVAVSSVSGRLCGWPAFETARIEAGIPRFGPDMDETNFPQECGIEQRAVSYSKGCYIGQEVLNRIHTMGHVNRELRGLRLAERLAALPEKGDKLFQRDKEVGVITSAVASIALRANIAMGYVRSEANRPGTELTLRSGGSETIARVVELPFLPPGQTTK